MKLVIVVKNGMVEQVMTESEVELLVLDKDVCEDKGILLKDGENAALFENFVQIKDEKQVEAIFQQVQSKQ